jgi:hypothetical protein
MDEPGKSEREQENALQRLKLFGLSAILFFRRRKNTYWLSFPTFMITSPGEGNLAFGVALLLIVCLEKRQRRRHLEGRSF